MSINKIFLPRICSFNLLATACMTVLSTQPVWAQNAPSDTAQPNAKESTKLEDVIVTGTRISNPNVVSPTPISVLTAEDIKATGAINIGDILTRMPQLATTFTMGNSGQGQIGTAGLALQDLRNLGPNRTLVLVNGRRFVSSSTDLAAVDTNLIPADWVERVEIITGGASAIYGADAVTGVVNFILKKNYQGVDLHAQLGTSQHGGFNQGFISATAGKNFAEDRGNFAISLEHSRQEELMFHERFGNQQYSTLNTPGGPTNRVLLPNAGSFGLTEGGTFSLGSTSDITKRYVFDPNGSVRKQRFDGVHDTARCQDCDYLPSNQVIQLQPKYNRTSLSSTASFDLTPEHRLYFEGTYSAIDSFSRYQPSFGSASNPIGAGAGEPYVITPDNAYVTPALAALMNGKNIKVGRFDVDAGGRNETTSRDTGRVVFGANGLLTEKWAYDANVIYGVTKQHTDFNNIRFTDRFAASIDAVRDPQTGQIVCRSSIDPNSINPTTGDVLSDFARIGCVPTSIFGNGAINAAARNWFNTTTFRRNKLTQTVAGGTLTNNDLFEVPGGAGSASFVAGLEYRKETINQTNDPLDISGVTFNNAIPNFSGSYNVKEAFAEFALPLLADKPFVKNLTLDAAARVSDYDTIGNTQAWKWGLDWAFDDNVRMRGTMSSAVRAPNINELFSGQAQNFFSPSDSCSASRIADGQNPAVRAANCAALGVPAGFESTRGSSVAGVSGSNPLLKPEKGNTYTFGFVVTPQFLPGFGFNADYWNIKLKDAISAVSDQDIVDRCVDAAGGINNIYCASATRDPNSHELNFIRQVNLNLSALNTSGIDFGGYYSHPLFGGKIRFDANATRVISFTQFPFQEDPTQSVQSNGTSPSGTASFPKWKATFGTTYSLNNWAFNWNMRYFSSMLRVTNESFASNPKQTTPITEGSRTYNDIRASYGVEKQGWQVYAGITNVFDRNPPVNIFGAGNGLYEALGRSYYVGFNYNFK